MIDDETIIRGIASAVIEEDRAQHLRCQRGEHAMLATASPGANLFPVTLSFPDPAGNGQPDMDIHVQGQILVYLNQNGQFVPQPSSH